MKRANKIGSANPFAALDSESDDDDQIEPVEVKVPKVISDSPVCYAIKIHWTKDKAITELKNFNVQNIKKDRAGILYLQFERESDGAKVLDWIRQKHRLNFNVSKVPLRTDPKCFICNREDHWGNACREGQLASFPREIIRLIGSNLLFTEILRLKSVSRSFNTAIKSMSSLKVKDPYGDYDEHPVNFKCDFLKTFQSLEELTLRNLNPETIKGGEANILDNITQCKSLRSLTLGWYEDPDQQNFTKIFSLTRLTRLLIKTREALTSNLLPNLVMMTNLVDLGLCTTTDDVFDNSLDSALSSMPGLTRLSLVNCWLWAQEARLILSEDILTRLVSLKTRGFRAGIYFGAEMKKLEELNIDFTEHWYPLVAPNLTRLVSETPKIVDSINGFVNLKYLRLKFQAKEKLVISLPNLEVLKITKWFKDADLGGCTNLKKLSLLGEKDFMLRVPPTITDLEVDPTNGSPQALQAICELPNLESLKIFRRSVSGDIIKALAGITSLKILSFNNADTMNAEFMKNLAQFTQLKILDLVHTDRWQSSPKVIKGAEALVLKLSSKLPNTKIMHGLVYHYDNLIPQGPHSEYCTCQECKGAERDAIEDWKREDEDEKRAQLHTPAKFNKFWYQ